MNSEIDSMFEPCNAHVSSLECGHRNGRTQPRLLPVVIATLAIGHRALDLLGEDRVRRVREDQTE